MVSHLKQARFLAVGTAKSAFFVAKQLTFSQVVGQGGAVDVHERPVATQGILVNGAGDHFLAGAGLADDEDGRVVTRHALDHAEKLVHGFAADDSDHVSDLDPVAGRGVCLRRLHFRAYAESFPCHRPTLFPAFHSITPLRDESYRRVTLGNKGVMDVWSLELAEVNWSKGMGERQCSNTRGICFRDGVIEGSEESLGC